MRSRTSDEADGGIVDLDGSQPLVEQFPWCIQSSVYVCMRQSIALTWQCQSRCQSRCQSKTDDEVLKHSTSSPRLLMYHQMKGEREAARKIIDDTSLVTDYCMIHTLYVASNLVPSRLLAKLLA